MHFALVKACTLSLLVFLHEQDETEGQDVVWKRNENTKAY